MFCVPMLNSWKNGPDSILRFNCFRRGERKHLSLSTPLTCSFPPPLSLSFSFSLFLLEASVRAAEQGLQAQFAILNFIESLDTKPRYTRDTFNPDTHVEARRGRIKRCKTNRLAGSMVVQEEHQTVENRS